MAFASDCSCECASAELDLFEVPPTQTTVDSAMYHEYHPVSSLNDGSCIEFEIQGSGSDYIDLNNSLLCMKVKLTQGDGSDLPDDDVIAPVNNFLDSLISQLDIYLNGTLITSSTNTYPFRAYLEKLLSYGEDAKGTQLGAGMYYKDKAGLMDSIRVDGDVNPGFIARRALAAGSRVIELIGRPHADIFFQERYLLNNVAVKLVFNRSKDAFCTMGSNKRKVKILSACMLIRKVRVSQSVALGHEKALEVATAKYPIKRVLCKTSVVSKGTMDATIEKLFSGQLPTRLVVALVDNEGCNGVLARNPYNFANFGLTELSVYIDGQQNHQIKPLKPDYASGQYTEAYLSLFTGTNKLNRDESNGINIADYPNGYCIYSFDLTPDLCEGVHFNLIREGTVRLGLKFATGLDRVVNVISYAEFENIIEIDRSRNVLFNFSS